MTKITVVSGQTVSGASLLAGDLMAISGGGLATDTTIAGGVLRVLSGGQSTSARVTGGGSEIVHGGGLAQLTRLGSGGALRVSSGGEASATTVKAGGQMTVLQGGLAETTRIAGGVEYDYGLTSGTAIGAGGREIVEKGALAEWAVVRAGGRQIVASGGMANNTVLSGGTLIVSAGGSICGGGFVIEAGRAVISGDIAAWNTVWFAGSRGTVELDNLAGFAATIAGFGAAQQKIDLGGFTFSAGESISWTQSGTSGTLTVTDGAKHASLLLSGSYTTGDFALADDGHGGTVITHMPGPPAAGLAQSMAALPPRGGGASGPGRTVDLAPSSHPLLATAGRHDS